MREGLHLLEEGYALADIDRAMRDFGMPMGPFEVVDEVGIDVANKVAGVLSAAFPGRMSPSPVLERLIAAGRLGKKSGKGFYLHRGRKRESDPHLRAHLGLSRGQRGSRPAVLVERMVLAMINEAARCLEEGVVADAGLLDLAMIFGAGFPPYRGGLMRHADTLGLTHIVARLQAHAAERGERYAPAALLVRLAESGGTFTQPIVRG
jgi:3-hydroxyacyl-CoA dehydrogenase/enoyl-CoA hydratase/3-hydroxybutyryl-CoA epimerase